MISFKPEQGNYLKTLPIHHSQVVVEDTKKNFIIKVCIIPSYEFYSKILSYGDTATVLSPESIRLEFEKKFINAVNNYKTVI
ncbi:hypothetical protein [Flavobacterium piscinae]